MSKELQKRIISSLIIFLIFTFCLFINKYTWLILVFTCCLLSWLEWIRMTEMIKIKIKVFKIIIFISSFLYLLFAGFIFYFFGYSDPYKFIGLVSICIFSDIGGYVSGKLIGGKKLTKISPNKTISGSLGSFVFSITIFYLWLYFYGNITKLDLASLYLFIFIPIIVSFLNQLGDLFISYIKRKARIKNTGKLIPGHGGILDRLDGIIFAIPLTILLFTIII
tara:strand:+ start:639 stop:1304 length:666 start_codon:yes stop_codon:yes gene_type:complete